MSRGLINAQIEDSSYVSLSPGYCMEEWLGGLIGMGLLASDGLLSEGTQSGKHILPRHPTLRFLEYLGREGCGNTGRGQRKLQRGYTVWYSQGIGRSFSG